LTRSKDEQALESGEHIAALVGSQIRDGHDSRAGLFGTLPPRAVQGSFRTVATEMASPYPPGIPVINPGERINKVIIEYLRTGVDHGMYLPDVSDSSLQTVRVISGAELNRRYFYPIEISVLSVSKYEEQVTYDATTYLAAGLIPAFFIYRSRSEQTTQRCLCARRQQ
jgi:hypothetical protein